MSKTTLLALLRGCDVLMAAASVLELGGFMPHSRGRVSLN
jgi:hypothetical protein